ncbi:MAG: HAMP domain-containing protein [Acidobacteriota bacterium]
MQKRITIAALLSMTVVLGVLGILSSISVDEEIDHSLSQSLALAQVTSTYTDDLLKANLVRLYDVSLSGAVDLEDGDWKPEQEALRIAYEYSLFSAGLFLLDKEGRIILTYPQAQVSQADLAGIPDVDKALRQSRPFLSSLRTLSVTGRRTVFAFAPLKDKAGRVVGAIGGEIDPTNRFLGDVLHSVPESSDTVIELVDGEGTVIASSHPERVFSCSDRSRILGNLIMKRQSAVFRCHRCHESAHASAPAPRTTDMLAFAPLREAPWGVSVREPERVVFAPSRNLRLRFLVLGLVVAGSAAGLGVVISRSIVNPIKGLTDAASRIAAGQLDVPVMVSSRNDEIGVLSENFESMRRKLARSLEELRGHNLQLEERVEQRTRQLNESKQRLSSLLHKMMSAQEDERKRIARELHDDTLQAAAALGLSLELSSLALGKQHLTAEDLRTLKKSVDQLIDGINRLIQDLRPPMLDDLGLDAAIRWLLDKHLASRGIRCHLKLTEKFARCLFSWRKSKKNRRFELTLFRIIQEAVTNIAKHSGARTVSVSLMCRGGQVRLLVQDDGKGFDAARVLAGAGRGRQRGYGILGLKERVVLLSGELEIDSAPGEGTSLLAILPVPESGSEDAAC